MRVCEADQSLWNARTVTVQPVRTYSLAEQRYLKGSNGRIFCREKIWEYNIKFVISEKLAVCSLEKLNCLGKGFICVRRFRELSDFYWTLIFSYIWRINGTVVFVTLLLVIKSQKLPDCGLSWWQLSLRAMLFLPSSCDINNGKLQITWNLFCCPRMLWVYFIPPFFFFNVSYLSRVGWLTKTLQDTSVAGCRVVFTIRIQHICHSAPPPPHPRRANMGLL
jgi:hypothetical protein